MKPSEFEIYISVKSYDENTAENDLNCYVAEQVHIFQTIKDIDPNFNSTNWILFKIARPYIL